MKQSFKRWTGESGQIVIVATLSVAGIIGLLGLTANSKTSRYAVQTIESLAGAAVLTAAAMRRSRRDQVDDRAIQLAVERARGINATSYFTNSAIQSSGRYVSLAGEYPIWGRDSSKRAITISQTHREGGQQMKSKRFKFLGRDEGSSVLELALTAPLLLLVLAGAVDIGRAYFYAIEVSSAAEAGALYGSQNPTDTAGMQSAAKLDGSGVNGLTQVASYGCECADGSSATPSCTSAPVCSSNVVNYVEVDTAYSYTPILGFPGIQTNFPLTGRARMHAPY